MVAVLVTLSITLVMVMVSLTFLTNSTKYSRYAQDSDRAVEAAQSGISDILAELRIDREYLDHIVATKDNPAGYCHQTATGGPPLDGDIFAADCGWDTSTPVGWQTLADGQEYHYTIISKAEVAASFEVLSTGRSNDVYRSVRARISQETSTMWLYLTDYEIHDPKDLIPAMLRMVSGIYAPNYTSPECGGTWSPNQSNPDLLYGWQAYPVISDSTVRRDFQTLFKLVLTGEYMREYCTQNRWGYFLSFDKPGPNTPLELKGPIHSNDVIYGRDAAVTGPVTTSYPACLDADPEDPTTWDKCVVGELSNPDKVYAMRGTLKWEGQAPAYRAPLVFPTTEEPKSMAADQGIGCMYQGPTRIVLDGDHMRVWSKETVDPKWGCGTEVDLQSDVGAYVEVPEDGLIYVDANPNVPPNKIAAGAIGDGLPLGEYDGTEPPPPTAVGQIGQSYEWANGTHGSKLDGYGNLWIDGEFTGGNLTVVADRSIIITGDIGTLDDENDLLGLMGGENVEIFNPLMYRPKAYTNSAGELYWQENALGLREQGRTLEYVGHAEGEWPRNHEGEYRELYIEAAIFAASGSFILQNYDSQVNLGSLYLTGSVAQRFAGMVFSGFYYTDVNLDRFPGGGYGDSHFEYNERLNQGVPLLFPALENGNWVVAWQGKTDPPDALK
ncbi:MAG: hypothetical protein LBJ08_05970 [Bifidobacteriaceae bacterium]|jgi:hypothetical protein|nr:hypothetical protein [Bifidobacteriaceae bacterium]